MPMESTASSRNLAAALLCLGGAVGAILVTGSEPQWANVLFFAAAALALLVGFPSVRTGWLPLLLLVILLLGAASSFLPIGMWPDPAWRTALAEGGVGGLAERISPQPWLTGFWFLLLVGTSLVGVFLVCAPLSTPQLAVFLRAVSIALMGYAVLCIVDFHSGWTYPFRGQAPFGLLPNKNHTATLLFVGAIVSFGLMMWEVQRGSRAAAVLAALCGGPCLAALLFFSNSRAGVVFLVAGFLIWAAGAESGKARKTVFVAIAVLAAFAAGLFVLGGSEVRDRLGKLVQSAVAVEAGTDADEAGAGDLDFRQPVFRDTSKLVLGQPWTGVGLGQFQYVFPHYRAETVRAARILHPESDWLMIAAEAGVPAALALLGLAVWYAVRSWRGRHGSDGMLRWTAASAVLAALLHGIVDVPWHRPAVGWFLLVLALASLPSSGLVFRRIWPARLFFLLGGFALAAGAFLLAREKVAEGVFPSPYRWESYNATLSSLGTEMRYEEGRKLAGEAMRWFPLEKDAHYWMLAFSRGDQQAEARLIRTARAVEPVLPQVAVSQAALWKDFDDSLEAEAWVEAVRRARAVDAVATPGLSSSAANMLEQGMRSLAGKPNAQRVLLVETGQTPELFAAGLKQADAGLAEEVLLRLPDQGIWLDSLPADLRGQVLSRWITLPSGGAAVAYMEARNASQSGAYWRQLANYYAKAGDKARAVGIVAEAEGVPLDGGVPDGEFSRQLDVLQGQGNEVAVRRLVKEAVEAKEPDAEKLRVALAVYAGAGDWEMAWRAASRLVTARKNGQ